MNRQKEDRTVITNSNIHLLCDGAVHSYSNLLRIQKIRKYETMTQDNKMNEENNHRFKFIFFFSVAILLLRI